MDFGNFRQQKLLVYDTTSCQNFRQIKQKNRQNPVMSGFTKFGDCSGCKKKLCSQLNIYLVLRLQNKVKVIWGKLNYF